MTEREIEAPPRASLLLAGGLFLAASVAAFEATAVITALPTIVDELDGSSLYGATLAAHMLANLVAITWAGEAADRHGPARPFTRCAVSFVVGLLVAGIADSMPLVVVGRVLQGFGVGGFQALAYVGVRRGFAEEHRPRLFAVLSAAWVLPSLIAPFVAGWITDTFGWRWVFLGIAPLATVAAAISVRQLRTLGATPHPPPAGTPSRVRIALRLTVGAALIVAGLPADHPLLVLGLVVPGVLIAAGPLRRLLPTGWQRLAVGVPAVVVCRICATFAFLGIDAFVPLTADRVHDADPTIQGAVIIGAALTWTVGQAIAARYGGRVAPRTLIALGFVLLAAGALLVTPVLSASTPLWATFLAWTVGGLGMGLLFNPTAVFAMGSSSERDAGLVSSQLNTADAIGFASVSTIGGAFVAASERGSIAFTTAIGTTFGIAVSMTVVGLVASRRVH